MGPTVGEQDHGDRLRRQMAVFRFLSAMHEIAGERDLVRALIQAAAVWFDLDARAYRRDLTGSFVAELWLPGADADGYPRSIHCAPLLEGPCARRVTSMPDLERIGWGNVQGELLLLPLATSSDIDWVVVISGAVAPDAEATLTVASRTAGAVLERQAEVSGRQVSASLRRRLAAGQAVDASARGALEELLAATAGAAGRLFVRTSEAASPQTLASIGVAGEAHGRPALERDLRVVTPERLLLSARTSGDGTVGVDLRAPERERFTPGHLRAAEAGLIVVATWLGGLAAAGRDAAGPRAAGGRDSLEAAIGVEMDRVRRLSLRGGVLVASFGAADPAPTAAVSSVIGAMREELRSSDLLGQLSNGEVAALLVRASADGVLSAAWRVRRRLERVAREHRLPPVLLGHALYPAEGADSLGALVERARSGSPEQARASFG